MGVTSESSRPTTRKQRPSVAEWGLEPNRQSPRLQLNRYRRGPVGVLLYARTAKTATVPFSSFHATFSSDSSNVTLPRMIVDVDGVSPLGNMELADRIFNGTLMAQQRCVEPTCLPQLLVRTSLHDFTAQRTMISLQSRIVLRRWATITHVQPRRRMFASMIASVSVSKALVASSNTRIDGSATNARRFPGVGAGRR